MFEQSNNEAEQSTVQQQLQLDYAVIEQKIKANTNNYINQIENSKQQEDSDLIYDGKTIKKRKDRKNCWYIRYYDDAKVQRTVYGRTQKEVVKNYKLAKKNEKEKPKPKELTLKEWFKRYMELYKTEKVTDTTIRMTNSDFSKLKRLHNCLLKDIDQFQIQETINKIPYASTRNRVYILMNALLQRAFDNELIAKNVMRLVDKPKYKAKEKTALTHQEEEKFIEACKKHKFGAFFLLCLYQGLRKGECRALKVNDVDFENMTLRIDESFNQHTTRTDTKNQQSNRIMPLFDRTKELLERLVKSKGKNDVIVSIGINRIDKALNQIVESAGIKHISTHILRHTFITRCQESNIPLFVLQSWVGHEKGSVVTTKIYTHLNLETNKKYVDEINKNVKK